MRVALVALLIAFSPLARAQELYTVDLQQSRLEVEVGRAGFLKIFGHDHWIRVERFSGELLWNEAAPEQSRFALDIDAASLTVAEPDISDDERAEVQSNMEAQALDLPQHHRITFTSSSVELRESKDGLRRLRVKGRLALRGVEKELDVLVSLEVAEDRLVATGELELESDAWGVPQIAAAGGAVKTSKELGVTFEIVATRRP